MSPRQIQFIAAVTAASIAALGLSGCNAVNGYAAAGLSQADSDLSGMVSNVKKAHDITAKGVAELMCSTSIGELARSDNPNFPSAVIAVCGCPKGMTCTSAVQQPLVGNTLIGR